MLDETPSMHSFNYVGKNTLGSVGRVDNFQTSIVNQQVGHNRFDDIYTRRIIDQFQAAQASKTANSPVKPIAKEITMSSRRMVQVYVADPDDQVPLDKALLYAGKAHLTDLTDEELLYDIGLPELLKAHNEYRKTLVNKKIKERTEYLEPTRIKNLSMLVITLAEFKK